MGGPETTWTVLTWERPETTGTNQGVYTPRRELRPQPPTRECVHHRSPHPSHMHTHSPEEGECLNLWVCGPLESWGGRLPKCWLRQRRTGLGLLSWLQQKDQHNWLSHFKANRLVFSFLSNSLFFFFLLTPSSSLSFFLVLLILSLPSYLFYLLSIFFKSPQVR